MTHICVSKQTIIGSDNGLSPGQRQAIIWTNAGILLIGTLGTNFSEILIEIRIFSFKKMGLKLSPAKWRPFCLGLNVLRVKHHVHLNMPPDQTPDVYLCMTKHHWLILDIVWQLWYAEDLSYCDVCGDLQGLYIVPCMWHHDSTYNPRLNNTGIIWKDKVLV